jgi:hypothetical protein
MPVGGSNAPKPRQVKVEPFREAESSSRNR